MDASLNIVELIENNPITKLSNTYNNKLLEKIKDHFTDSQQQLFISSFYCYLNYSQTTDFIIDLDNIWEWLGFSQKAMAKRTLEKNFIPDKDYKCLLCRSAEQKSEGRGGHNKETIMLNIRTFKLFCLKSETQKASEIHEYFVELEELLHEVLEEESNELRLQLEQNKIKITEMEEDNKLLQIKEKTPYIYIYNIDTRFAKPELKIGYTKNINERIRPYKQISKHGRIELTVEVVDQNIRTVENFIHHLLDKYKIKDEVFSIDVEEAKIMVLHIVNTIKLFNLSNDSERQLKLKQLYENEQEIIDNQPKNKISTREMSTQTDFEENMFTPMSVDESDKDELTQKFDKYIKDHCIVRDDVEISTTDIIGQYRILEQSASKEVYHKLKDYLDKRFKPYRLKVQDKNQVINGYMGVTLKELKYNKSLVLSTPQNFIFHACIFSPSGKVLFSDLLDEYQKWKAQITLDNNLLSNETNEEELKKYLKSTGYVLYTTIWANNGGGQGYYGLFLKKDNSNNHKTTSSTGKKVEKRSKNGDFLLGTWESIARAAEAEKCCSAKMSRSIKECKIFNNDYYFCVVK
jgi:phage anti-repressor protein